MKRTSEHVQCVFVADFGVGGGGCAASASAGVPLHPKEVLERGPLHLRRPTVSGFSGLFGTSFCAVGRVLLALAQMLQSKYSS